MSSYRHSEGGAGHHSAMILQKLPAHHFCDHGGGCGELVVDGSDGGGDVSADKQIRGF